MKYGSQKETTYTDDQGSTITKISVFNGGYVVKSAIQHKVRVKVSDARQQMAEYIRFTDKMAQKKMEGTLLILSDDPSTIPAFQIEYPKNNIDGSYFVVHCWTERKL